MRRNIVLLTICSIALAWGSTASAQRACVADLAKFCKGVQPGEGRQLKCLYEHRDGVSEECKSHVRKTLSRGFQVHMDCLDDTEKFCGDVQPGQGRVVMCLNEHRDSLSDACRGHVEQVRQAFKGLAACREDARRLCNDVAAGQQKRVVSCLREHRDQLSETCGKFVERHDKSGG